MQGEPASNPNTPISRVELMRWLWPHCDPGHVALQYLSAEGKLRPGWIHDEEDALRAMKSFAAGKLHEERFETVTQTDVSYTIAAAKRLGLVLHRDGMVSVICLDLDDHTGDGGNLKLLNPISRFLGATPVVFTSKSGKGVHAFFELGEPMPVEGFVAWAKGWGFNRPGQPELFPKTAKHTQLWMPGEPNEHGGDTYKSGTFESAVIQSLPELLPVKLTNKTLGFLRGEATEPGRNSALNVAAMELGQKGVDRELAWRLCQRAALLCGLEPGESERTFQSGYSAGESMPLHRTEPAAALQHRSASDRTYELTGIGNAERFVAMFGHDVKYCAAIKSWYAWDTSRWVCDGIRAEGLAKLAALEVTDEKHRRYSCSKRGIDEILHLARSDPSMAVRLQQFDADPMLFNCQSGTIDLRTGQLRSHDRKQLLSRISPVRYAPGDSCSLWREFLQTVFGGSDELIGYIQRMCGYMLTGDVREQCLFFMHGDGCNGKSVFASVLQFVLGDYARKIPAQILSRSDRVAGEGPTPFLSTLVGARLASASELEEGQKFAESRIKNMTGGDRQIGRGLRQDPIEFDPMFKLLLYGNHRPEIVGVDHGIWRRIHLIPFLVTIPDFQRDPQLVDKLKSEAGAILRWMVDGCMQWQQRGLCPPDAVVHATSGYRAESDTVGRFITECCTRADGVFVMKGELHQAYVEWCTQSGEESLKKNQFGTRVKRHGLSEKKTHAGWMWVGLELSNRGEEHDA